MSLIRSMCTRVGNRVIILDHDTSSGVMAAFVTGSFEFVTWTAANHDPTYMQAVDTEVMAAVMRANASHPVGGTA